MNAYGEHRFYGKEIALILAAFAISRALVTLCGIHMKYDALYKYWQYLDIETLRHHLLLGIWYDHAQPPFFNLLLGIVLKISGSYAPNAFGGLFKVISLINSLLLFIILRRLVPNRYIPVLLSLLYLLSPASLILESELFYTTFVSMLLLTSAFFLLRLQENSKWLNLLGLCLPLIVLCLTRSMYHILWLAVLSGIILYHFRRSINFRRILVGLVFSMLLVAGWYIKNYLVFGQFSTSSWMGMNLARIVFHDYPVKDSSRIEAFEPFSAIPTYNPFIKRDSKRKYAGLDDRDLLQEMKNDSFKNENHIEYIEISEKYMEVSKQYIKSHPLNYLKNVLQSCISFFAPATRYPYAEEDAKKIKYYDLVYSFNLSHFSKGAGPRRIALTISAVPKIIIYLYTFFILLQSAIRQKKISMLNLIIMITIGFVFSVSSLIEHFENMRFRYEIEPLFLILLGQVIWKIIQSRKNLPA